MAHIPAACARLEALASFWGQADARNARLCALTHARQMQSRCAAGLWPFVQRPGQACEHDINGGDPAACAGHCVRMRDEVVAFYLYSNLRAAF